MRHPLITVLVAALLAGCGYKGPLYLPKPKPVAQNPAPKPAPAQDDKKPESEQKSPDPERGTESR